MANPFDLATSLKSVYEAVEFDAIRRDVDAKGIDKVISDAALMAGSAGAVGGFGGGATAVLGIPAVLAVTVAMQFRVTAAVIYHKTGEIKVDFERFIKIVAVSLGVDVGVGIAAGLVTAVAGQILVRLGARSVGIVIPLFGALVGGATSYAFITTVASTLMAMDMSGTPKTDEPGPADDPAPEQEAA